MPGPGPVEVFEAFELVVLIGNQQRNGAAECLPVPNAAKDFDVIGPRSAVRPPRPYPPWRRRSSTSIGSVKIHPGRKAIDRATSALPCDSPAVQYRNILICPRLQPGGT